MANETESSDISGEANALCHEARRQLGLGEAERAIELLGEAGQRDPGNVHVYELLGVAYGRAGRLAEAALALEQAVAGSPGSAVSRYNLAVVYQRLGKLPEAEREYRQALRCDPAHGRARSALRAVGRAVPPASPVPRPLRPTVPLGPDLRTPPSPPPFDAAQGGLRRPAGDPELAEGPPAAPCRAGLPHPARWGRGMEPAPYSATAAAAKIVGKPCSICQTGISPGEEVVSCPGCGLPFHAECWQEIGGCGSYGCSYMPQTVKAPTGAVPTQAWGDTKACPRCFQIIPAVAVQCPYCREVFGTVEPMTRRELLARRERQRKIQEARVVSAVILAASLICLPLQPVTAIAGSIWLAYNWHEPLGRMEPTYRILATVGVVVAGLLTVGFVIAALGRGVW